jgi:hypothetical protein
VAVVTTRGYLTVGRLIAGVVLILAIVSAFIGHPLTPLEDDAGFALLAVAILIP